MRMLRSMTAAALAAALLAGCGDDDDPSDFDPAGMSSDIESIGAVLEDDVAGAYLNLVDDMSIAISGGGAVLRGSALSIRVAAQPRPAAATVGALFGPIGEELSASRASRGLSAVRIPNELLGTTFEWNTETGEYEASAAAGAPANGVRFILYAVNPVTGEIALPLNEVGHVDLVDGSTATTEALRVQVVSGSTTYIDYGVALTPSETTDLVVVDGFITDGDERLNFDLRTTFGAGTFALDYELELEDRDLILDYTVDVSTTTVDLAFVVRSPNGEIAFTGGGNETVETYVFEVNGEEFATLTFDGDVPTWVSADGDPLTAGEQEVLEMSYDVTFTGFAIALLLMTPVVGAA